MKPIPGTVTGVGRVSLAYEDARANYLKAKVAFETASAEFERNPANDTFQAYCDATEAMAEAHNKMREHA